VSKNLFLFGNIGAGKSTLIRECLLPYLNEVGGFYVQRIFCGNELIAFSLKPITDESSYELTLKVDDLEGLDNLFLYLDTNGKWQSNNDVFLKSGLELLQNSIQNNKKLILLDELGGIELHNKIFMTEVYKIIKGSIPLLGVVKAPKNARILERINAGKGVTDVNLMFIDYLNHDQNTELLNVDNIDRNEAASRIYNFVEEVFNG